MRSVDSSPTRSELAFSNAIKMRIREAEKALADAKKALDSHQAQLQAGERKQAAAASAFRVADAERRRLATSSTRRSRRAATVALQQLSWLDPAEGQREFNAARELGGVDAKVLAAAEMALQAQRQRINNAKDGGKTEQAERLVIVRGALNDLIDRMRDDKGEPSAEGEKLDALGRPPRDARLATLLRMLVVARDLGVDPATLLDARDAFRHGATLALKDAIMSEPSIDAAFRLQALVKLCDENGEAAYEEFTQLVERARGGYSSMKPQLVEFAVAKINAALLEGSVSGSVHDDVKLLEEVIDAADSALLEFDEIASPGGAPGEADEDAEIQDLMSGKCRQLMGSAEKRLVARRAELADIEQERCDTSSAAWETQKQQLQALIKVAEASVEANEERVRIGMDLDRIEQTRREAVAIHSDAMKQREKEEHDKEVEAEAALHEAKEEVKRLKGNLKVAEDSAAQRVKKAEDDMKKIKQKAEADVKQAQSEVRARRRELEKTTHKLKTASEKKEREHNDHEAKIQAKNQAAAEKQAMLLAEEQERVRVERQMAEEARAEADKLRKEQDKVIGEWQAAERAATQLAQENAAVAKKALEAQKMAEDEARHAHQEVKNTQDAMETREHNLIKEAKDKEEGHELERLQAQQAIKETEMLKARQQELQEELKEARVEVKEGRDKHDELEKTILDQRADKQQQLEKYQLKVEEMKALEKQLAEAKEEIVKLRAETADAVEKSRKARKEFLKLKSEVTELANGRTAAETELAEVKGRQDVVDRDLEKARDQLRQIDADKQKHEMQLNAQHRDETAELTREHERALKQKEAQLEYAEDQLTKLERKVKIAAEKAIGPQQRLDADLAAAYAKIKERDGELEKTKKELEETATKCRVQSNEIQRAVREKKEVEERSKGSVDRAEKERKAAAEKATTAEEKAKAAVAAEKKATTELTTAQEQLKALKAQLAAEMLAKEQAVAVKDAAVAASTGSPVKGMMSMFGGGEASPPGADGSPSASSPVLSAQHMAQLARAIASELGTGNRPAAATRAAPREVIESAAPPARRDKSPAPPRSEGKKPAKSAAGSSSTPRKGTPPGARSTPSSKKSKTAREPSNGKGNAIDLTAAADPAASLSKRSSVPSDRNAKPNEPAGSSRRQLSTLPEEPLWGEDDRPPPQGWTSWIG